MDNDDNAEHVKLKILNELNGLDVCVALTALTFAMSTVIVGTTEPENDEEMCQVSGEALRECVAHARKYLESFKHQ